MARAKPAAKPSPTRPKKSAPKRKPASAPASKAKAAGPATKRKAPTRAELEAGIAQLQATVVDLRRQLQERQDAPKNPAEIPTPAHVDTSSPSSAPEVGTLPVRLVPQAHGGVLKEGGTRGPGRPKNIFRQQLQGDLEQRRQFLLDVIDGKDFVQPGLFGPIVAPPPINQRQKAWDTLAKYAIGPADPGNSGETRRLEVVMRRE